MLMLQVMKAWVVLIKRAKEPFMDKLVLPGGHVEKGEELREACVRESKEEINFEVCPEELTYLCKLDSCARDPRSGRRVSTVFHINLEDETRIKECVAMSDARDMGIFPIASITKNMIGFDHYEAICLVD